MALEQSQALLSEKDAEVEELRTQLEKRDRQIDDLTESLTQANRSLEKLQQQMEQLLRRVYGPRSERHDPNQLVFEGFLSEGEERAEGTDLDDESGDEEELRPTKRKKRRRPHGRDIIPEHLERREVLLDLPEEEKVCPETGKPLVCMGYEESEKLEYEPGHFYVNVYKRPKYVSPDRQSLTMGVKTAPMPEHPILKCKADLGLLANVLVMKYEDHLPLYRMEGIFRRERITIPRTTLCGWTLGCADALAPLYDEMKKEVLSRDILFTDDTIIPLLEKGRGKTKRARMWVYVGGGNGPPYRLYDFTEDRRKERPLEFLGDYRGYIHADAYSGYDVLFRKEHVIEVGCWAHCRRKFHEALSSSPREATEAVAEIKRLYQIERQARELTSDQRRGYREDQSHPVLDELFSRFEELSADALPQSPLGQALTYALNQKDALHRFLEDGRLEIDNNTAENAIRPLALGRKNWLFAGSPQGGKAAATIMSLTQTCRALGINAWEYLRDVLGRIMSHNSNRVDELLPANWKEARE